MPEPLLLSIADAAEVVGISRSNLYKFMQEGKLSFVKVGKRRLVQRTELERFVARLVTQSRREAQEQRTAS